MIDGNGRKIDYIRISVTDRCNLRCIYCMPEEGVENVCHPRIMRFDEILRVCRILAQRGVRKVKLTGGEPLVRRGIIDLVREIKVIDGIENVTITTNGVLLEEMYDRLVEAGIDAITVSLDSLDPEVFRKITRRDDLEQVRRGLRKAITEAKVPVKINCVPVLGIEEQRLTELIEIARNNRVHVRFIEMMPIGMGSSFPFVKEDELKAALEEKIGTLTPCSEVLGNGPCQYYSAEGFQGKIGFISAVSHKFCGGCNRIRLTSEGFLKTCLQYDCGAELKPMMNAGCSDEELAAVIEKALREKPLGHDFGSEKVEKREQRGMSQIGG